MKRRKGKAECEAFLAGLHMYLREYVMKYYPRLEVDNVFVDERGAFALCGLQISGKRYTARLRIPRNAPPDARPLFDSLYLKDQLVWRFSVDYRPNVPWGEQRRIHLYHFEGFHALVHVVAGSPKDIVEKVTHLNGSDLSPDLAAILRMHVARLWGMTTSVTNAERRILASLQKKGVL